MIHTDEASPRPLVQVGGWPTIRSAHEHALVLLAMGLECSVHHIEGSYVLFTHVDDAPAASRELELYSAEQSKEEPSYAEGSKDHPAGILWLVSWAAILAFIFSRQVANPILTNQFSNSSNGILEQAEWWRPFTALFLHGDIPHLLGNLLIGGVFCIMAAKSLGASRSWPLIMVGGTVGNLINAIVHRNEPFSSIGASTATFSALGLLVGLALTAETRRTRYLKLKALSIPLVAGTLIFSMFGTAGENTDVSAHLWGALCGVILGAFAGWRQGTINSRYPHQRTIALRCVPPHPHRLG